MIFDGTFYYNWNDYFLWPLYRYFMFSKERWHLLQKKHIRIKIRIDIL